MGKKVFLRLFQFVTSTKPPTNLSGSLPEGPGLVTLIADITAANQAVETATAATPTNTKPDDSKNMSKSELQNLLILCGKASTDTI